jgi:hypothetical protein
MNIVGVNWGFACSSLLLGGFSYLPYIKRLKASGEVRKALNDDERIEAFFRLFEGAVIEAENPSSRMPEPHQYIQRLKGYKVHQFAFLTASTLTCQEEINFALGKLGFHRTEATHNTKNNTTVIFWMIEMPKLWAKYKVYLEQKAEKEAGE